MALPTQPPSSHAPQATASGTAATAAGCVGEASADSPPHPRMSTGLLTQAHAVNAGVATLMQQRHTLPLPPLNLLCPAPSMASPWLTMPCPLECHIPPLMLPATLSPAHMPTQTDYAPGPCSAVSKCHHIPNSGKLGRAASPKFAAL